MKDLNINIETDFSPIAVKIISVEKQKGDHYTAGAYYEVETDIVTMFLFGDSGRSDAKILKEQFEGKDEKAILNGCFYENLLVPHPIMPFVMNARKKSK